MIVKILSSTSTFKGVRYNTDKVETNKGELIKVVNFGPLQGLDRIRPEDYVNYLKMICAQNKNVKSPQFHVALSTKGRMHSKDELTIIAEKWLAKMGYSNQPYLIIFHKDTKNNHVHIVSARVDREGKKISSAFERVRAVRNLNQVMGVNEEVQAKAHFEKAMSFNFSTKAQFMMILESYNYSIAGNGLNQKMIKFGAVVGEFNLKEVTDKIALNQAESNVDSKGNSVKDHRIIQLTAIFNKYLLRYSSELLPVTEPLPGGREKPLSSYTSDFAAYMKQKMGVEIIFHSDNGRLPYGYSVIDHPKGNGKGFVFKGNEIMHLKDLLNIRPVNNTGLHSEVNVENVVAESVRVENDHKIINNDSDEQKSCAIKKPHDEEGFLDVEFEDDLSENVLKVNSIHDTEFQTFEDSNSNSPNISVDIADDIDDEAILGRNRRRQKKARTNTR